MEFQLIEFEALETLYMGFATVGGCTIVTGLGACRFGPDRHADRRIDEICENCQSDEIYQTK